MKYAGKMQTGKRTVLALLATAQLVIVLDFSIVQIALPTIRTDLAISLVNSQWIVSAYGLTFASLLLLSARMSDLYGRRRMFTMGLVLFAIASAGGGLAPTEIVLIAARAIQGIGGAIVSATALSLIAVSFPEGPDRDGALSVFSAVSAAGFAVGVRNEGFMLEPRAGIEMVIRSHDVTHTVIVWHTLKEQDVQVYCQLYMWADRHLTVSPDVQLRSNCRR